MTAPLVGYDTEFSGEREGEIERDVIRELNVDLEGFRVPAAPELASKGRRREIVLPVKPEFSVTEDDLNEGKTKVLLEVLAAERGVCDGCFEGVYEGMVFQARISWELGLKITKLRFRMSWIKI